MCSVRDNTKKIFGALFPLRSPTVPKINVSDIFTMKIRNRTIRKHLMGKTFFSSWGYALHFCWSNLMITGNFSNSAAQFLLVGAYGCISCFQDELSVLKAFTLKVLSVPIKKFFFEWQVYLSNSFVPFQKQIKQPCHIELHLSCGRVPGSTPVFFLLWK